MQNDANFRGPELTGDYQRRWSEQLEEEKMQESYDRKFCYFPTEKKVNQLESLGYQ
jgi:hypothetical protein